MLPTWDGFVDGRGLADAGAVAVMPMGSLIGSGGGVANPAQLELL